MTMQETPPASADSMGARPVAVKALRRRLMLWAILLLGTTVTPLLLAEIALRLVFAAEEVSGNYWGPDAFVESDTLGYRHAPGYRGFMVRRGVFRVPVAISPEGLRQSDLGAQLRFQERVLILGDSYAFGLGVREEHAVATLIQPALNAREIGVVNGAQTGYCVEQETRLGLELIERFAPRRIVIFVFLGNDVEGDFIADFARTDVRRGFRLLKERWLPVPPVDFLRTRSYLCLYAQQLLDRQRYVRLHREFLALAESQPASAFAPTLAALRRLRARCDEHGIQLGVVLVQPKKTGRLFYRLAKRALREDGIPFLDLERAGFSEEDYFVGDGHWDEDGHRKVARQLTAFVLGGSATGP
jgi:lysophospholipase L1-like esterase